jgi:hypothetical protein
MADFPKPGTDPVNGASKPILIGPDVEYGTSEGIEPGPMLGCTTASTGRVAVPPV